MDQRLRFIADLQREYLSLSELCRRFGVSRKTAYKWIERYEADGPAGLVDRSRRPQACSHQTPARVVERPTRWR
jgi:transposase